jgi:anti-sigma factor ChrR (cupin superfamily)
MDQINAAHDLTRAAGPDRVALAAPGPGTTTRSTEDLPWTSVGRDGTEAKVLRLDPGIGASVTLLRFARGATTGLHTHTALATSYFLSGSLLDFQGEAGSGELGVNLPGATHDACATADSILVSRLDGPVLGVELTPELRGSDRDDPLTPVRSEVLGPPDINITAAGVAWEATAFPGVERRTLWQAGPNQSVAVVRLQPGAEVPRHLHFRPLDTYVLAGEFRDEGGRYAAGDYAYTGAGTRRSLTSATGCELLCWADGPAVFAGGLVEGLYVPPSRLYRDGHPSSWRQ